MHSLQMLLEVIEPWPDLLRLGASLSEALVFPALAMFWLELVNTLSMSLEVIDGREALCSRTARFLTHMLLFVPSCMFPAKLVSNDSYQ